MKRSIYIILALIISSACSKILDVEPTASIDVNEAIKNKRGVERALNGTYDALQQAGSFGRNMALMADLAADNLSWTGTTYDYGQIADKKIPSNNAVIDGMWTSSYDVINRANNIIERLPSISDMTDSEKAAIDGECKFIRALMHFDLVRFWGQIPLKLKATTDLNGINTPGSSKIEVINAVISDLKVAMQTMSSTARQGYASGDAAKALLVRAYLYRFYLTNDVSDLTTLIPLADEINSSYPLAGSYASLFGNNSANTESLFEVVFNEQDKNVIAQYLYPRSLTGRYEFAPTTDLINSFEPDDQRAQLILIDASNFPYANKYQDVSAGTDRVYVIRSAETQLILAEAKYLLNEPASEVLKSINNVRNRAGLSSILSASQEQLLPLLLQEYRHEFAFEGHRWHDLTRTNMAVSTLGIEEFRTLWPIPISETQSNSAIKQNEGY